MIEAIATDANNENPREDRQIVYRRLKDNQYFTRSESEFIDKFQ